MESTWKIPLGSRQFHSSRTKLTLLLPLCFIERIHSHNDYWRDIPLFTALSYGAQSIEADVWYYPDISNNEVFVGHHQASLTLNRTLNSLYLEPLMKVLNEANPKNDFTHHSRCHVNGVFDTDPRATLFLFIDIKTEGYDAWRVVYENLKPLRDYGYLSFFNGEEIVYSAITIIGTGNTPYELINEIPYRDVFLDGDLLALDEKDSNGLSKYHKGLSPIASTSLRKAIGEIGDLGINETQKLQMSKLIDQAHHSLGIMTRFWDLDYWPTFKKYNIYKTLRELGCDFLNADDLQWVSETMF